MANKLYVLTVATPRADLHRFSYIPFLVDFLRNENANFEVVPIINLDKPSLLSDEEFQEAKEQFEDLDVHLFTNTKNPSFSKAARKVYLECSKLVNPKDNNVFMWLEDDWFFDFLYEKHLLDYLNHFFDGQLQDKSMMLLTTYVYFCGNPSFFRKDLFDQIVHTWKAQKKNVDPEFVHFESAKTVQGAKEWRKTPHDAIISRTNALFIDGGRSWRRAKQIGKRARIKTEDTWFSCPKGTTEGEQ